MSNRWNELIELSADMIESITCDKSIDDEYGVENLLLSSSPSTSTMKSTNFYDRSSTSSSKSDHRGFMTSSFVRPPINVKYRFKSPIDLRAIRVGLRVSNQRTLSFQIFVSIDDDRSTNSNRNSSTTRISSEIDRRVFANYYNGDPTEAPESMVILRRNCGVEQRLASMIEESSSIGLASISMEKSTIGSIGGSTTANIGHPVSGNINFFDKVNLLRGIRTLTIRITRAHYVACLGYVRFYAQQQRNASILSIDRSGLSTNSEDFPSTSSSRIDRQGDDSSAIRSSIESDGHGSIDEPSIPNEFYDPITNACMSLPIILPSGHTIDRSTLEKYVAEEARFGRPANDPFTNVRFTDVSSPIPNARLKERIDRFFLSYPNLARLENIGRTLCGADEYVAYRASSTNGDRSIGGNRRSISSIIESDQSRSSTSTMGSRGFNGDRLKSTMIKGDRSGLTSNRSTIGGYRRSITSTSNTSIIDRSRSSASTSTTSDSIGSSISTTRKSIGHSVKREIEEDDEVQILDDFDQPVKKIRTKESIGERPDFVQNLLNDMPSFL